MRDGRVHFHFKDYRDGAKWKPTSLQGTEFIRRFLLHVLPSGFMKIRHYGFLANRFRNKKLAHCRDLLGISAEQESGKEQVQDEVEDEQCEQLMESAEKERRLRCPKCKIVRRKGVVRVICQNSNHKQRQG